MLVKSLLGFLIVRAPNARALNFFGSLFDIFGYRLSNEIPDLAGICGALFPTAET